MSVKGRSRECSRRDLDRCEREIVREHERPFESERERERRDETLLVIRRISERGRRVERRIELTGNTVRPRVSGVLKGGAKRGKIMCCSDAAMRRMEAKIDSLEGVELNRFGEVVPCDEFYLGCKTSAERGQKLMDLMHRASQHGYWESIGVKGYWKKEWKRRKSGLWVGEFCPHIHLLASVKGETRQETEEVLQAALVRLVMMMGLDDEALNKALKVLSYRDRERDCPKCNRWVESTQHMVNYAKKYTTKKEDADFLEDEGFSHGRSWGRFGGIEENEWVLSVALSEFNLSVEDERRVFNAFWKLVAEEKEKDWVEVREWDKDETEEQRKKRRERWDDHIWKLERGMTYTKLSNARRRCPELLALAVALVREGHYVSQGEMVGPEDDIPF